MWDFHHTPLCYGNKREQYLSPVANTDYNRVPTFISDACILMKDYRLVGSG